MKPATKNPLNLRQLFSQGGNRALPELREAGKISVVGAGISTWQICERLLIEAGFWRFLLTGRYTLLEQDPQTQRRHNFPLAMTL